MPNLCPKIKAPPVCSYCLLATLYAVTPIAIGAVAQTRYQ